MQSIYMEKNTGDWMREGIQRGVDRRDDVGPRSFKGKTMRGDRDETDRQPSYSWRILLTCTSAAES